MNQGRIWCVVKPTVGLPLFLGSVATISLLVHTSVLTNTNWMARFFQGASAPARTGDAGPAPATVAAAPQAGAGFQITVAPAAPGTSETGFVITVTPTNGGAPSVVATAPPSGQQAGGNTYALAGPAVRSD